MSTIPVFSQLNLNLILKIPLLILIALYGVIVFMLIIRLHSLSKIIFFPSPIWSLLIRTFTVLYFLAILTLFATTLVVV